MFLTRNDPDTVIAEKGLIQITDSSEIERVIGEILEANKAQVEQYKAGKTKVYGFFVGEVMRATKGKASPELVNKVLREKLQS